MYAREQGARGGRNGPAATYIVHMPSNVSTPLRAVALALVAFLGAACGTATPQPSTPSPVILADSTVIVDLRTGARIAPAELARRMAAADIVLLGEQHDNAAMHRSRASLLRAQAPRRVSAVFEHFARSATPIAPPAAGEAKDAWLDRNGFDRKGWQWPLHAALVDAALDNAAELRGTNLSREALRDVVRKGGGAAPAELRRLTEAAPMDSGARAILDADLVAGHCGQLPAAMVPGMRDAQVARDAAMAEALLAGRSGGQPWLLAGNGHVRADIAVPRLLRVAVPTAKLLVVGFVELGAGSVLPALPPSTMYDIAVFVPAATRPDPCAGMKAPAR